MVRKSHEIGLGTKSVFAYLKSNYLENNLMVLNLKLQNITVECDDLESRVVLKILSLCIRQWHHELEL